MESGKVRIFAFCYWKRLISMRKGLNFGPSSLLQFSFGHRCGEYRYVTKRFMIFIYINSPFSLSFSFTRLSRFEIGSFGLPSGSVNLALWVSWFFFIYLFLFVSPCVDFFFLYHPSF